MREGTQFSYISSDILKEEDAKIKVITESFGEEFNINFKTTNIEWFKENNEKMDVNDFFKEINNYIKNTEKLLSKIFELYERDDLEVGFFEKKEGYKDYLYINIEGKKYKFDMVKLRTNTSKSIFKNLIKEAIYNKLKTDFPKSFANYQEYKNSYSSATTNTKYKTPLHHQLGTNAKEYHQEKITDLFNKYIGLEVVNAEKTGEIVRETTTDGKIPKKVATIREDAKHTLIFPLSEEEVKKYKKEVKGDEKNKLNEKIIELHEFILSQNLFKKVEVDMTVNKTIDAKIEQLNKVQSTIEQTNSQNLSIDKPFIYRIRKIYEKRNIEGMYIEDKENINDTIVVDPNFPGAFIHELAHLIDFKKFKKDDIRNYIIKKYKSKIKLEDFSDNLKYYLEITKPTEIIARLMELAYLKKYPNEEKNIIRLVDNKEFYEMRSKTYFNFEEFKSSDWEELIAIYDVFFEDVLSKSEKEEKLDWLKINKESTYLNEGESHFSYFRTEEDKEKTALLKILRAYNPEITQKMFDDIRENPNNSYHIKDEGLVMLFYYFLSTDKLNQYNNVNRIVPEIYMAHNLGNYKVIREEFNKIDSGLLTKLLNANKEFKRFNGYLVHRNNKDTIKKSLDNIGKKFPIFEDIELELKDSLFNLVLDADYGLFNLLNTQNINEIIKKDANVFLNEILEITNTSFEKSKNYKARSFIEKLYYYNNYRNYSNIKNDFPIVNKEDVKEILKYIVKNNVHFNFYYQRDSQDGNIAEELESIKQAYADGYPVLEKIDDEFVNRVMNDIEYILRKSIKKITKNEYFAFKEVKIPNFLNKEGFELLVRNAENKEDLKKFISVYSKGKTISELKEIDIYKYLSKEDKEDLNIKMEIMIKKEIPEMESQKELFLKKDFLKNIIDMIPNFNNKDMNSLLRAKSVLNIINKLYIKIETIENNKIQKEDIKESIKRESTLKEIIFEEKKLLLEEGLEKEEISEMLNNDILFRSYIEEIELLEKIKSINDKNDIDSDELIDLYHKQIQILIGLLGSGGLSLFKDKSLEIEKKQILSKV